MEPVSILHSPSSLLLRFSVWPQHHSPIYSIADGGVSSLKPTDQPGSDPPTLVTCSNLLIPKAPAQSVRTVEFPEPPPYRVSVQVKARDRVRARVRVWVSFRVRVRIVRPAQKLV